MAIWKNRLKRRKPVKRRQRAIDRLFQSKKSRSRRKRKNTLADFSWQVIGMTTIIIVLITWLWGGSLQASAIAEDNFFHKTFSEVVASFDINSFGPR